MFWRWSSDGAACSTVIAPAKAVGLLRHVDGRKLGAAWRRLARSLPLPRRRPVRTPAKARARARIPVTIVTGFLGAGKTTLIRRFLAMPEGKGSAVIINEYGAVGIDDALVRDSTDEITLLGNGCLCCNTRSDLQIALRRLVAERQRGCRSGVSADRHRDQRARRSGADPADVLDRSRARRRILRRGRSGDDRRRRRSRDARMVGGSAQAGDPRRPTRDLEDRPGRAAGGRAPARAAARAQPARRDHHRGRGRDRSALPDRDGRGRRRPAAMAASWPRPSTAMAF